MKLAVYLMICIGWLSFACNYQVVATKVEKTASREVKVDTLDVGTPYLLPLAVLNKEIRTGDIDVKLMGFDLTVRAYLLPDSMSISDHRKRLLAPTTEEWFRAQNNASRYFRWNEKNQKREEQPAYMQEQWKNLFYKTNEMPLLSSYKAFANLEIRSQIKMAKYDSLFIGQFQFQPEQPGLYWLTLNVRDAKQTTDSLHRYVYFQCPKYNLELSVKNKKLLHHISYKSFAIPLVTSVFFENNSDQLNANAADTTFRNAFVTMAAKRMAGKKYTARIIGLHDSSTDRSPRNRLDNARANILQNLLDEKMRVINGGRAGEAQLFVSNGTKEEWKRFYKFRPDFSPAQFSQENRAAILRPDPEAEREIFRPLEVVPDEPSDEVVLTVEKVTPPNFWEACIQRGEIVITDSSDKTIAEPLPLDSLHQILGGQKHIQLDSKQMRDFLGQGTFTAKLHLTARCSREPEIWSNAVEFSIKRRLNVTHDVIFALNRYDTTAFANKFDYERVNELARQLLKTASDTLLKSPSAQPPDALVLISGHACILGNLPSPLYNLGLSFARAFKFRDLLLASIHEQSKQSDSLRFTIQDRDSLCTAKRILSQYIDKPDIKKIIDNCAQASDGRALEASYEDYLQRIINEKVRHFRSPTDDCGNWPQGIPDSAQIVQRIEEIRQVLPGSVKTLSLTRGTRTIAVRFVAVGFGSAVPFYRRFKIDEKTTPEVYEAFKSIGLPSSFYGDDRYPAGRQMNRRVEVNLIW